MNKRLIDRFTEEFEKHLSNDLTPVQTFEKAKDEFERVCGFTPYINFGSFKSSRWQDRKKQKKAKN